MTQLFLEREFDVPLSSKTVLEMAKSGSWCFEQYGVKWHESLLAKDGMRMVCRFEGPDAESIRQALGRLDADMRVLWNGTVHHAADSEQPNVLVERSFDEPVELAQLQAQEDEKQWCLDNHGVKFARTLFSRDRRRMICLYRAPDAESVHIAQQKAGMPLDRVWSFVEVRNPAGGG